MTGATGSASLAAVGSVVFFGGDAAGSVFAVDGFSVFRVSADAALAVAAFFSIEDFSAAGAGVADSVADLDTVDGLVAGALWKRQAWFLLSVC